MQGRFIVFCGVGLVVHLLGLTLVGFNGFLKASFLSLSHGLVEPNLNFIQVLNLFHLVFSVDDFDQVIPQQFVDVV